MYMKATDKVDLNSKNGMFLTFGGFTNLDRKHSSTRLCHIYVFNHYDSSHIVIMYHDIGTFAGGDRAYMYIVVTVNEANPHLKTSLSTIMVDCELENHKNIYKRT